MDIIGSLWGIGGRKGAQDDVKCNGCDDDDGVIEAVAGTSKPKRGFFSNRTAGSAVVYCRRSMDSLNQLAGSKHHCDPKSKA